MKQRKCCQLILCISILRTVFSLIFDIYQPSCAQLHTSYDSCLRGCACSTRWSHETTQMLPQIATFFSLSFFSRITQSGPPRPPCVSPGYGAMAAPKLPAVWLTSAWSSAFVRGTASSPATAPSAFWRSLLDVSSSSSRRYEAPLAPAGAAAAAAAYPRGGAHGGLGRGGGRRGFDGALGCYCVSRAAEGGARGRPYVVADFEVEV